MPLETEHGLIRRHSAPVVNDLYECPSGILNDHGHLICPCIYGILNQLLHHRRRSLNDLTCSYHIGYIAR